jgi:acyl-CoA thioesterase-1
MAVTPPAPISRRLLLAAGLAALPASALAARGQVVTMLGDSITAGQGLAASAALPAQLHAELLRMGIANLVRGAGVSGDTTGGGLARVNFSVQPDTAVVVVALGANDLLRGLDPKVTRANLDRILTRLKERRMGVVLAGITAPPQIGRGYARDFNGIFPSLARAHGAALYPNLLAGVGGDRALNQADGLHPNAKGARIIAAGLAPVVARVLRSREA